MGVRLSARVWCGGLDEVAPDGVVAIRQRPSRAFGSGRHPTTQLAARAVHYFGTVEGYTSVLDVGAGTGVLAQLARACGAERVCGVEIDPVARAAFRENVAGEIELCERIPAAERFDLVVANILEEVLLDLRRELVAALAPRGRLLLSGFTREQTPRLIAAFNAIGLDDARVSFDAARVWTLLQLRNRDADDGVAAAASAASIAAARRHEE